MMVSMHVRVGVAMSMTMTMAMSMHVTGRAGSGGGVFLPGIGDVGRRLDHSAGSVYTSVVTELSRHSATSGSQPSGDSLHLLDLLGMWLQVTVMPVLIQTGSVTIIVVARIITLVEHKMIRIFPSHFIRKRFQWLSGLDRNCLLVIRTFKPEMNKKRRKLVRKFKLLVNENLRL